MRHALRVGDIARIRGELQRMQQPGVLRVIADRHRQVPVRRQRLERGLEPRTWAVVTLTAVLALVASFLVSYTRARAEALGLECRVGWFERPERMVVLIVAAAFGVGPVMPGALLLLTVLSFATAIQRVVYVWESTRRP